MKAIAKENYYLFQRREQEIKIASSKNSGETEESAYNVEATVFYLEKVPLFKKCTKTFFNSLALHTSITSFQKGENIIKKGDEANEMYIIINGKVQVVSEDGSKTFDTMKNGAFFGEGNIKKKKKNNFNIYIGFFFKKININQKKKKKNFFYKMHKYTVLELNDYKYFFFFKFILFYI